MSNPLAISAVTGVLQYYFNQLYNHPSSVLGTVNVSAVAPDVVMTLLGTGTSATLQVNLFMHQVSYNAAWRNSFYPAVSSDGSTALSNPPLALDLHYLLTAYATGDGQAEALLSYAVLFLDQTAILPRAEIRTALAALPPTYSPAFAGALAASGLADQIEMITITPEPLGREETAWVWTALKADYRPTFPFRVSVILIDPARPTVSALPVLQRGISAQSSIAAAQATLTALTPPNGQSAAVLGNAISVQGSNLASVTGVQIANSIRGVTLSLPALPGATDNVFSFILPNPTLTAPQPNPTDIPAGIFTLTATLPNPSGAGALQSNSVPLIIAPRISPAFAPGTIASGTSVTVQVPCVPYLRPGQQVSLLIGGQQSPAAIFAAPTNTPSFTFPSLQPTGRAVPVRLRVDGVDSLTIDMTTVPPTFTGPSVEVT